MSFCDEDKIMIAREYFIRDGVGLSVGYNQKP